MNPEMFHFTAQPRLERPSFIIGWTRDIGGVSSITTEYLTTVMDADSFCQIDPAGFFPVSGVSVEDDIAQFPESRFFNSERDNVVILRSDEPQSHRYRFLNAVLDLAEHYGGAEALYTINGVASMIPHSADRRVFGVFNDPALQARLLPSITANMDWQGPPHTSTYLLWLAKNRHIPGAGLWFEVPFYLANYEDARAIKAAAQLLNEAIGADYDVSELDEDILDQDEMLEQLREDNPEVDARIRALEEGETLNQQEQVELAEAVQSALKGQD